MIQRDVWLTKHLYLQSVADFHAQVQAAAADVQIPPAPIPNWNDYIGDYQSGIPLLQSPSAAIDVRPAERILRQLLERLVSSPLPDQVTKQIGALNTQLHGEPDATRRAVSWLINKDEFVPVHPGPLRYLGWTALACFLRPVVGAFASWRNEESWLRCYCPTCAATPSMAQLVGNDPCRLRLLCCGPCGTRWRYRRTGCPFCEQEDGHRLAVVAIEGEAGLRIDYCESCGGYLKTYAGEGNETVLLADWTSLHLDVLARDRGLKRLAGSLYEL